MTQVTVIRADQMVVVDGDAIELDFGVDEGIQAVLAKEPDLHVLRFENAFGYIERRAGISQVCNDETLIQPFLKAHKTARRRLNQAAKRQAERQAKEESKRKKEHEDREAEEKRRAEEAARKEADERAKWEAEQKKRAARQALEAAFNEALNRLAETDLVAIRCLKSGIPYPQAWQDYDAALRQIARDRPPDISKVEWPIKPAEPEGMQ